MCAAREVRASKNLLGTTLVSIPEFVHSHCRLSVVPLCCKGKIECTMINGLLETYITILTFGGKGVITPDSWKEATSKTGRFWDIYICLV